MTKLSMMNYFGNTKQPKVRIKKFKRYLEKSLKIRKYNNIIEAIHASKFVRKLAGVVILDLVNTGEGIAKKFSIFGFIFFIIWNSLYFYCSNKSYFEDQTILRNVYKTKMQRYGDDCEKLISVAYSILSMWKIPFCVSCNLGFIRIVIDVDKALENLGEKIDYNRDAYIAGALTVGQLLVYLVRLLSIWLILKHLDVVIPIERMFQVVYTDGVVLIVTTYYCFSLTVLRHRFQNTNKILVDINTHKCWEYKLFVRGKMALNNMQKAGSLQDKYISEKIRSCAKIYGMLYKITVTINDVFGLLLVSSMFVSLFNIILYLFYFMEATSSGLFHDIPKYIDFTIYVFGQIGSAIGILYLIVYFCECVTREAREAAVIVHEIMSSDLSPSITNEALQLSLQLLHQKPIFTAYGLYKLNKALFVQGTRSVSTYLVMLLQFVTDANL